MILNKSYFLHRGRTTIRWSALDANTWYDWYPWGTVVIGKRIIFPSRCLLDQVRDNLFRDFLQWVLPSQLFNLARCVLVDKLIDWEIAPANSHNDLVVLHSDVDSLGPEHIDTLAFAVEHDSQSLAVWIVVDVVSETSIYEIVFVRDIESIALLDFSDFSLLSSNLLLEIFILCFCLLQKFDKLERCLVGLV